jgi:hypothetical protein
MFDLDIYFSGFGYAVFLRGGGAPTPVIVLLTADD